MLIALWQKVPRCN